MIKQIDEQDIDYHQLFEYSLEWAFFISYL